MCSADCFHQFGLVNFTFSKVLFYKSTSLFWKWCCWIAFSWMRFSNLDCVKSIQIRSYFWSVFSCIWTECGEIWSISLYSVRIQENTDQKKLRIWTRFTQWYCTWSPALRDSKSFKEILKTKSQRQSPSDVL